MSIDYFSRTEVLRHAVSTPLTTIMINTEMALSVPDKKHYSYHLQKVLTSAHYIASLMNTTQREDLAKTESFDIFLALQEVFSIGSKETKNVEILTHISHLKNKSVEGNKLLFQESIICLLNNAVESYRNTLKKKIVCITASLNKQSKKVRLAITDGGSGMALGEQEQIFSYGFSKKENHHGIGLSFAHEVITKQCNGSLNLQTAKNRGTTIKISLNLVNNTIAKPS